MNDSILLIQSKQPSNKSMGTGFVIHQDSFGSYVLTCSHVVTDVVDVKIEDFVVEEIIKGSLETIDLAVLYVKGLFRTPLELQDKECNSKEVELIGYSTFSKEKYQLKTRDATILTKKMKLTNISDNQQVPAWQIIAHDNNEIESGNSGAPLFCKKTKKVMAVVSNRKNISTGYALAIENLKDLWQDMPPLLLEGNDASPFVGLSAFSIEESHLFFGRDKETQKIIERLKKQDLVAVVGDSGSGKSSVIKAGVIPKYLNGVLNVEEEAQRVFHLIEMRPATNPFKDLSNSLKHIDEIFDFKLEDMMFLKEVLESKDAKNILNAFQSLFRKDEVTLLLYIDQFEELFTLCEKELEKEFITLLLHLLENQSSKLKIKIVFTMRRDYYNLIAEYESFFKQTQASKYTLRRMKNEQIKECIEKPLEKTSIALEQISAFSKAVLQDMGDESSELTLLQIALTQTWKHKNEYDNNLLRTYHEIGEVSGALAKLADDTWQILSPVEQRILKYIFIRIIQPSGTGGVTRRLADKEEFSSEAWELVQKLSSVLDNSGKVTNDRSSRLGRLVKIRGRNGEVVELIHEALVTQWPTYQYWLKEANKNHIKIIHDRVIEKTKKYQVKQKKKFLLMGYELEESINLLEDGYKDYLSDGEIAYIEKSSEQEKRTTLFKRSIVFGLILLTATSIFFGVYAKIKQDDVQRVLRNSYIEQGLIYKNILNKPIKAKLLFAKSVEVSLHKPERRSSKILYENISNDMKLINIMEHNDTVWNVIFSKDKKYILSCSSDKSVKMWDRESGKLLYAITHNDTIWGVEFSQDSQEFLYWDNYGVSIRRVLDGKEKNSFLKHITKLKEGNNVWKATFSTDNKSILTWNKNSTKKWSRTKGLHLEMLIHKEIFKSYSNSTDEKHILCSVKGNSKVVELVSRDRNDTIALFTHDTEIKGARFSNDEQNIFTWDKNGTFKIWDKENSYNSFKGGQHGTSIKGLKFNSSKKELLTWGEDEKLDKGTISLWKVTDVNIEKIKTFYHDRWVNGADFSKNEQVIFSWSKDKSLRLWNKQMGKELLRLRHNSNIRKVKLSKDETKIVSYSDDGLIRLWSINLESSMVEKNDTKVINGVVFSKNRNEKLSWGKQEGYMVHLNNKIFEHKGEVYGAKFSKDEKRILSWGSDKEAQVILWDKITSNPLLKVKHDRTAIGAEFDNDGFSILSWSKDGVLKLSEGNNTRELLKLNLPLGKELLGISFSKDKQKFLTWSKDNKVILWERSLVGVEEVFKIEHKYEVEGACFSQNEKEIFTWGESAKRKGIIKVRDSRTNEEIKNIEFPSVVLNILFNREKNKLLTWHRDGLVKYMDYKTEKNLLSFKHNNWVRGATLSSDEQRILSWSEDGTLKLWDIENKKELLTLKHSAPVVGAEFTNNDKNIISWNYTGEIKNYELYRDIKDYVLEVEVNNGVELTDVGEVKPLSLSDWRTRKEKYDSLK